jgi:PAS domain S-box-containing protein
VKVVEAQRPWLIGAIALSLAVLALALILLYRSRVYRKRLVKEESQVMVREADERAQLMLEQAPLVSLLWDDDFHLIDCNQEAVKIFGLSSKKEIMERFFELLPEYQPSGMTSRELFQKAHSLMFKEKTEFARIELTMKHSVSGEAIPFDITLARIKYKDKYAVLSYGLDLRERNATIAKMREADECAQIMFDITPLAGCMFDKDRNMIDCNQEVVKMFGIPDRKFFLNSFFSLLIPKYQPDGSLSADVTAENVRLALEKGYYRFECMHQKLSGEPLPSEITLVCVKYRGENVIAGYFRDLTEQKEKEQLTKEVMGKTSTLTAIFNSTPNIIFCKDINLFYTECNKAMENYFNISRSDVIGKSDLEGLIFSPETAEQLIAVDKRVIAERQTIISEELLPSSDGRLVHFEIIKSPLIQEGEITGLVGMARDITQRKEIGQLAKKQAEAEAANRAKSTFLATMSHEIRTPMNAISGMAELLLRRDLPDEAKAEAQDIKQAATNLVSIINDILDISKIEAGKMEILPVKYMLLSLINDTVNIIRMRLAEKPIRFYTNIDGNIPNNLIGDEVRLRQILLNLLSNAAKYTDKGHISLSIIVQKRVSQSAQADSSKNFLSDPSPQGLARGQIWLEITVADTGKGIKPEDQTKIFDSFVQVDSKKNRSIEGTGLGLAITKQLCQLMNGNITFHSEYGKGSEFKAVIPQGVDSEEAFAAVEEPEKKKVLVYEGRAVYARSLCWSLENLGVPYVMTETLKEFTEALTREEWYYVFSGHGLYEKIKPLMDKAVFLNGKKPPLALMVEWENEANIPGVRFISLPVQSLSIANVLNGKADSRNYFSTQNSGAIRFTYPGAHLLVVDDIPTNLRVAEGLLAPYRAKVDIALSGAMAIELVKQYEYDIVFMDHMMPEMDGIEATAAIREWETEQEKQGITRIAVPIIALTANVVSGMKEMFIEKGFNDFLAKPIDISKLDEMLDRWIPKGKRGISDQGPGTGEPQPPTPDPHSLPAIPGVDIRRGISMTGGTLALYRQVIGLFRNDAEERLPLLQNVPDADALPKFITQVHALKSASASIGAAEISAKAAGLEAAGRAADIGFIQENLPGFVEDLTELIEGIRAWENAEKEQAASKGEGAPGDGHSQAAVIPLLHELETALEAENVGDIRRLLRELGQKPCDAKTKEALGQISDHVLVAEFDSALKIVKELIAANG